MAKASVGWFISSVGTEKVLAISHKISKNWRKDLILGSYSLLSCIHFYIHFCNYSKICSNLFLSMTWRSMIGMYTHDMPSSFWFLKFQENGAKSPPYSIHICEYVFLPPFNRRKSTFVSTYLSPILGKIRPLSWKNVKNLCIYLCTQLANII